MLLSGDNSDVDYNEPQVMYNYLLFEHDIRAEDLVRDYAGLRTYDTCARAKSIWKIDKAILISQGYHLSRAIFTCNNLDVKSTGFSATKFDYTGQEFYKIREILALHRAVWDVFISPPDSIILINRQSNIILSQSFKKIIYPLSVIACCIYFDAISLNNNINEHPEISRYRSFIRINILMHWLMSSYLELLLHICTIYLSKTLSQ